MTAATTSSFLNAKEFIMNKNAQKKTIRIKNIFLFFK
ncbi:MAG: hypothetical protein ACI9D4_002525 [Polaribacter sp.]